MFLKASLHSHTADDPRDCLDYSAEMLIDTAHKNNFNVLAITCHDKFVYNENLKNYAAQKNILLIPGIEKTIENKHVLILNADPDSEKIQTFADLKAAKKGKDYFVIAPHPYFIIGHSLGKKLAEHIELFDAIEHSFFYSTKINRNLLAEKTAKKYNLPLIGTADIHYLKAINYTYCHIETSAKTIPAVITALRQHRVTLKTTPLNSLLKELIFGMELPQIKNKLSRLLKKV